MLSSAKILQVASTQIYYGNLIQITHLLVNFYKVKYLWRS